MIFKSKDGNSSVGALHMERVRMRHPEARKDTLKNFNMEVSPGEFISILGPSGTGKTTLLRVIAGFESVDEGYVRIAGRLVASSFANVPANERRVGFVFQDYALFPHMTVTENVEFGLRNATKIERRKRVKYMLDVTGLSDLANRFSHEISGGERQRVALARALAPEPVLVLMDEPFSNLDRQLRADLRRHVKQIVKDAGITTILVTHDREEAFALADRIAVMENGQIQQIGNPSKVYDRPINTGVAKLICDSQVLPGVINENIVHTEVGKFPFECYQEAPKTGDQVQVLLRASRLMLRTHEFGAKARVIHKEFYGEFTEYRVKFPSGLEVNVRQPSGVVFSKDQSVNLFMISGLTAIVYRFK